LNQRRIFAWWLVVSGVKYEMFAGIASEKRRARRTWRRPEFYRPGSTAIIPQPTVLGTLDGFAP